MSLTVTKIQHAKARTKPYKLFDSSGLYLEVSPSGGKLWRLKYRIDGKENRLALGKFPDVSLKDARERRDAARKQIANGIDPAVHRRAAKTARAEVIGNSFEVIAREWYTKRLSSWAESTSGRILRRLEVHVFPFIGNRPIAEVTAPELLSVLHRIENTGAVETAHRAHRSCSEIFRYAIATGRCDRDPAADLKGALAPGRKRHFASITDPKEVGGLLRAIDGYEGKGPVVRAALQLAPLVFVRPGELRAAEWSEFDLHESEWRIPPERMKGKRSHLVPLSKQAVAVLTDLQPRTGSGRFVFPNSYRKTRCMSDNTLRAALHALGYTGSEMTVHGFRSMASTLLHEQGWNSDVVERQLAHTDANGIRAAYNYAQYLPERRRMMQAWADYLDGLKAGVEVVPLKADGRVKRGSDVFSTRSPVTT